MKFYRVIAGICGGSFDEVEAEDFWLCEACFMDADCELIDVDPDPIELECEECGLNANDL